MTTTYTTVIVTRNRPEALALSLPLHLAQSRRPDRILVIDSSDDPGPNRALVARLAPGAGLPVEHQASPPGMTVQRNIGLAQVETDVVFFPDDDSLVYPGALEAMMRVYDRDTGGVIGGVCSAEATEPPPGVLEGQGTGMGQGARPGYEMRTSDRIKARIAHSRYALEARFFPDPFALVAERLARHLPPAPAWLAEENAITVPWMTGFRMSYRTAAVRRFRFNEYLGRYALFEDIDAGLGVLRSHLLVGARNAQIYHHKAPERRSGGRQLGALHVLNRGYVVCRSGETGARVRAATRAHARFKIAQYALGSASRYERERLGGAVAAYRALPLLFDASPERLDEVYLGLRTALFGGGP